MTTCNGEFVEFDGDHPHAMGEPAELASVGSVTSRELLSRAQGTDALSLA